MKKKSFFYAIINNWIEISKKKYSLIIILFFLLTILLSFKAKDIKIDTDFKKLLPKSYPTVKQMDVAIKKIGELGYFTLIIENNDIKESIKYAEEFAKKFKDHKDIRVIEYKNPVNFLKKYFFQFVSIEQYQKIRNFLNKKRAKANPFMEDLEEDLEEDKNQDTNDKDIEEAKDYYKQLMNMKEYHVSDNQKLLGIKIRPRKPVTNLTFTKKMFNFLKQESEKLKKEKKFSDNMKIYIGGSLKNKIDEYKIVMGDVLGSLWLAGLLVLLVLFIYFRNIPVIILILIPLLMGLIWSATFTTLTIGFLNIISATLFTVLMGLGIDHGIHLVKNYLNERENNKSVPIEEVMKKNFQKTGKATLISALTTSAGFFLLMIADFKGFSELGFVAGSSMLLIISAYFFVLPSLLFLSEKLPFFNIYKKIIPDFTTKKISSKKNIPVPRSLFVLLVLSILFGGAFSLSKLKFDYDFTKLQGKVRSSQEVKKKQLQIYKQSSTPGAVMFTSNDQNLDKVLNILEERKRTDKETPTIGRIMSKRNFIPTNNQKLMEEVRLTAKEITPIVLKKIDDPILKDALENLKNSVGIKPANWEETPEQLKALFLPQDGSSDNIIFIFPSIERKLLDKAIMFSKDISGIKVDGKEYIPTGDSLIMAKIVSSVITQGLEIILLSLLAICLMLFLQFLNIKSTLRIMFSLIMGLSLMTIFLLIFNVSINFFNMVIIAVVIGMGIDATIHIYTKWDNLIKENKTDTKSWEKAVKSLTGPITASILTTIAGYLGMVFSHHPGIRSIGLLAIIGLGSCFLASLTIFPLLLKIIEEKQKGKTNS